MIQCKHCSYRVHRICIGKSTFLCKACEQIACCQNDDEALCLLCKCKATDSSPLSWIECEKCKKWFHRACVTSLQDSNHHTKSIKFLCCACYCECHRYNNNKLEICNICKAPYHGACQKGEIFKYDTKLCCLRCKSSSEFGTPTFEYHKSYAEKHERYNRKVKSDFR